MTGLEFGHRVQWFLMSATIGKERRKHDNNIYRTRAHRVRLFRDIR